MWTGGTVYFNSTAVDPDGQLTNWTWRFGDGHRGYGAQTTHRYAVADTYIVELIVRDDGGASAQVGRRIVVASEPLSTGASTPYLEWVPGWLYWVLPLVVGIILWGLSYFVVSKGQPAIYNLVFFLFFAASGTKSITEAFAVLTNTSAPGLNFAAITVNAAVAFCMIPLFLWFVLVFPRPVAVWLRDGRRGVIAMILAVPFLLNQLFGFIPFERTVNIFNAFQSIVVLVCLGLLIYHGWETDSEEERHRIHLLTATFFLLVLSSVVLTGLGLAHTMYAEAGDAERATKFIGAAGIWGLVVSPLLEIIGAIILLYAVLKYQLLGVERFVMRATRGGLLALLVPAVFVVVSNGIEQLFQVTVLQGVEYDFLIAGFISALLMIPLQKWVTFLINRLFPGAQAHDAEYEAMRRMEIYEAQVRYCLLDGALNQHEIEVLRRLSKNVGLRPEEIDGVIARFPKADLSLLAPAKRPRSFATRLAARVSV